MYHKRYAQVVGSTGAHATAGSTTSPSRVSPGVPYTPGTKAMSRGEALTFENINRAQLEAHRSIDLMSQVFEATSVRVDRVDHSNGSALSQVPSGAATIQLGGAPAPVAIWLYHGLFKSELYRCMRLCRARGTANSEDSDIRVPNDVLTAASVSVFPAGVTAQGSAFKGMPSKMAPMRRIAPAFAPYNGGVISTSITEWYSDGIGITARTWADLYARPGCFVEIPSVSGGLGNEGLYKIVSIANRADGESSRAVLTTSGLHKVTLSAPLGLGTRVSWSLPPDNEAVGPTNNTHYAYVAYIMGSDHYLLANSGSTEFPIPSVGALGVDVSGMFAGREAAGSVGALNPEAGNSLRATLVPGTIITDSDGVSATVSAVVQSGEPKIFQLPPEGSGFSLGTAFVVSPPGFALSPTLGFSANNRPIGGNYLLECLSLSTVGERLISGAGVTQGGAEDPTHNVVLPHLEYVGLMEAMKTLGAGVGHTSLEHDFYYPYEVGVNSPLSAKALTLGEARWRVTFTNTLTSSELEDHFWVDDVIRLKSVDYGDNVVLARILSVTGNVAVLTSVRRDLGTDWVVGSDDGRDLSGPLLVTGGSASYIDWASSGTHNFVVSSIDESPQRATPTDGGVAYLPEGSLTAFYRNLLHSDPALRTSNLGRWLELDDDRPLELVMNEDGYQQALRVWGSDDVTLLSGSMNREYGEDTQLALGLHSGRAFVATSSTSLFLSYREATALVNGASEIPTTELARVWYDGGVVGWSDQNTGVTTKIPFSGSAPNNALPDGTTSVLGALQLLSDRVGHVAGRDWPEEPLAGENVRAALAVTTVSQDSDLGPMILLASTLTPTALGALLSGNNSGNLSRRSLRFLAVGLKETFDTDVTSGSAGINTSTWYPEVIGPVAFRKTLASANKLLVTGVDFAFARAIFHRVEFSSANDGLLLDLIGTADDLVFEHCIFHGNIGLTDSLVTISGGGRVRFVDCVFYSSAMPSTFGVLVRIAGKEEVSFERCTFRDAASGINAAAGSENTLVHVIDCTFSDLVSTGIIDVESAVQWRGCKFTSVSTHYSNVSLNLPTNTLTRLKGVVSTEDVQADSVFVRDADGVVFGDATGTKTNKLRLERTDTDTLAVKHASSALGMANLDQLHLGPTTNRWGRMRREQIPLAWGRIRYVTNQAPGDVSAYVCTRDGAGVITPADSDLELTFRSTYHEWTIPLLPFGETLEVPVESHVVIASISASRHPTEDYPTSLTFAVDGKLLEKPSIVTETRANNTFRAYPLLEDNTGQIGFRAAVTTPGFENYALNVGWGSYTLDWVVYADQSHIVVPT